MPLNLSEVESQLVQRRLDIEWIKRALKRLEGSGTATLEATSITVEAPRTVNTISQIDSILLAGVVYHKLRHLFEKIVTFETGFKISEGSNAAMGVATLTAGEVTVSNTRVTANSRIFLTAQNLSGIPGALGISARSAGVSFTIQSDNSEDTRNVAWLIVEPS